MSDNGGTGVSAPLFLFIHHDDYLRFYRKARKAERRGDPVEALKWFRLSNECLRAAARMNNVNSIVHGRGGAPADGDETITGIFRGDAPGYAKREKNPQFERGRNRNSRTRYWVQMA